MPSFKDIVLFIHRWLGLITGLVVVILSLTGCLFVFHQEISNVVRHDTFYADEVPANRQTLPVEELQQKAADALDTDRLPYGLTTYKNPEKNWSAMLYKGGVDAWTYFGSMEVYKTAYINPYDGEVEGIVNEKTDFFQIVKGIHWSLLLATPIGQPIVVWSTVIFIILLITGMVLWWPKKWNKAGKHISFIMPADRSGTITATVYPDGQTYYEHFHINYDQYTGELIAEENYENKNAGEKLLAMNYDIHVGAIGGLPGKIIAFLASLICGSLPITGFIIWWDRKKRKWRREERLAERRKKSDAPRERIPA